ncbi:MAG: corrinoid protein-associated methyltransferase CpaM [Anaerolineae bacterium]
MSTYVFMKVLESAPRRYDKGMTILTLGRLERAKEDIAALVNAGEQVLDIGCGTGTLAVLLAQRGAQVVGVDISASMLEIARARAREENLEEQIELRELGAVDLDTAFEDQSFDCVVSTLTFSELSEGEIDYTLQQCWRILKEGGKLIIADEILPTSFIGRVMTFLYRLPFVTITYLLTQNTTKRVADLDKKIAKAGFKIVSLRKYLLGTLQTYVACKEG